MFLRIFLKNIIFKKGCQYLIPLNSVIISFEQSLDTLKRLMYSTPEPKEYNKRIIRGTDMDQITTVEQAKQFVYDELCEFIGTDMSNPDNLYALTDKVNLLIRRMKLEHNFITLSDFSPYFEFMGLTFNDSTGSIEYHYEQRKFK
jgi:hypothetical protein